MIGDLRKGLPSPAALTIWMVLLTALAALSALAARDDYFAWDLTITRGVQAIDSPTFRRLGLMATFLASPTISLMALGTAVVVLLIAGQPRLALFNGASAWAHLLGGLLKLVVDRPRPSHELVDVVRIETRFSYPSGHAEWVMGFEGFLVFVVWHLTENRVIRAAAVAVWIVHLGLAGVGRVEQGLHWPSDVLAGYLVGVVTLMFTVWAYRASRVLLPGLPRSTLPQPPGRSDSLDPPRSASARLSGTRVVQVAGK